MKRLRQIFVVTLILVLLGLSVGLQPRLWRGRIETLLNNHVLVDRGWRVSIQSLGGHFLTAVTGRGIVFTSETGATVSVGKVKANLNFFRSLFAGLTFDQVVLENLVLTLPQADSLSEGSLELPDSFQPVLAFKVSIRKLWVAGKAWWPSQEEARPLTFAWDGAVKMNAREGRLSFRSFQLQDTFSRHRLYVTDLNMNLTPQALVVDSFEGIIDTLNLAGSWSLELLPEKHLSGELFIKNYVVPRQFFTQLPLQPKFSSVDIHVALESDLRRYAGSVELSNALGLDMRGAFQLVKTPDYLRLEQFNLRRDEAELEMTGLLEKDGRLNSKVTLTQFDLSRWLEQQKRNNFSGTVFLDGTIHNRQLKEVTITMEMEESALFVDRPITASGTVIYAARKLSIPNPLTVTIGPSSVILKGECDLRDSTLDLQVELNQASVFLINNFWADSLEGGMASGTLTLKGALKAPDVEADLTGKQVKYHQAYLEEFIINTRLKRLETGYAHLEFKEGQWRMYPFNSGQVELSISPHQIDIVSAEFRQGENILQFSGSYGSEGLLTLNPLQLVYDEHYLINTRPLTVQFTKGGIALQPFAFHVDDGVVNGYLDLENGLEGRLKLSGVDAAILGVLGPDDRWAITGKTFGELSLSRHQGELSYTIDLTLKNGTLTSQPFDELTVSAFYLDSVLHVEDVTLLYGEKTGAQITGIVPLTVGDKTPWEMDLSANLKHIDLALFTQFIPHWFHLEGIASGDFNLGGTPRNTKFDFDLTIEQAQFDRLPLGMVTGTGLYDGQRLYFNRFASHLGPDQFAGSGYLPVDLNFGSPTLGHFIPTDSLWIDVQGQTRNLKFLTLYLADVDSVTGKFDLRLNLSGPPEKVLRNGSLSVTGGRIYSLLLDDPIVGLAGSAEIVDNYLKIRHLDGYMPNPEQPSTQLKKPNLHLTGGLDLSRFFEPRYALNVQGQEIYFRTLLGDIEGTVNVDLAITGKDTITFAGDIEVLDVVMYQEFTSSSSLPETPSGESRIVTNYLVNFPITGNFALRNSQLDAQLSGQLSIAKLEDYPPDYTGELFVRSGKFYYYGDVFTLTKGYLGFDKKGFNPYLDISAFTTINQEQITITLVGQLDNPRLVLESSSGFSQSDILELLTLRSRFEDQEMTSAGFGVQAQTILGAYLESQLERNFLQMSGLKKLGLVDQMSISGTTGFLNPESSEDFTISAGRQLSENLSLYYSYQRSFSLVNPPHNQLGVELKLNRYFSVVGNVDESGNMHVKYRLRYSY